MSSVAQTLSGEPRPIRVTPPWSRRNKARRVGFLLVEGFPLVAFGAALDPLRSANDVVRERLYEWPLMSIDGRSVRSSSAISLHVDGNLSKDWELDDLFVVAGATAHRFSHSPTFHLLRELSRKIGRVGSISGGVYLLARAGLLEEASFSVHWELYSAFREEFPTLRARPDIFVIDGNCLTCAGGTTALDLMLCVIAEDFGRDLASKVGDQLVNPHVRKGWNRQRSSPVDRYSIYHSKLSRAIELMERHIDLPLTTSDIAQLAGMSQRQIERLFKESLQCTPTRFYTNLRLDHARQLLIYTPMRVIEVAMATGFGSHSHFSKAYRECFGITPTEDRRARRLCPKYDSEPPRKPASRTSAQGIDESALL